MKKLIVFLAITSLFACDKSDDIIRGVYWNISFEFSVFNSQDVDLLDPATPNHIEEDDIRLFYEIDGKILGVYNPYMDNPRNFMIYEHENEYRIKVVLNDSDATEETITHIQWNDDDTDVIKASLVVKIISSFVKGSNTTSEKENICEPALLTRPSRKGGVRGVLAVKGPSAIYSISDCLSSKVCHEHPYLPKLNQLFP